MTPPAPDWDHSVLERERLQLLAGLPAREKLLWLEEMMELHAAVRRPEGGAPAPDERPA